MKRRNRPAAILMIAILLFTSVVFPAFAQNGANTPSGDVNGDGRTNSRDARLALRGAARIETLSAEQTARADMNADGVLRSGDARAILQIAAKTGAYHEMVVRGSNTGTKNTYTGYESLPEIHYTATDPNNKKGLSKKTVNHSFGVAKNGKVHSISYESQKFFDEKGVDAVTYDNKTEKKVLYLTFDCGYENGNTGKILDTLKEKGVSAAFFCTLPQVKSAPELTKRMILEGHIVGNHSVHHPNFTKISAEKMAQELEEFDNYLRRYFGYCSSYFRYPEGAYSEYALSEVNSHGFRILFWSIAYEDWNESNQRGADYAYRTVVSRLHPGAVILLHAVSRDNAAALGRIIDEARAQGYEFRRLTDLP